MPENKTYTIFDNDYLEYCKAVAQDYPDTIYDFFPNFPQDTDGMDDLLETIGLDEDEAEEFLDEIRAENREDGLDLLVEKIQATVKTDSERRNVESFFEDQMLNEDVQWFSECFDDQCQEDVITGYDMISIDPKEPHLCLGSDMGWRNLSGYSIMKPKENIAQSLMESINTDTTMKITYTEGDPCLRAKAYTHDSPMGESYTIIPQSMARKAFESKELHDQLSALLSNDDDVKKFLYDAKALPDLEKDPVSYGIVQGMIDYSYPLGTGGSAKEWERSIHNAALKIASFNMSDFERYCAESDIYPRPIPPSEADSRFAKAPYEAADAESEAVYCYLSDVNPAKESPVTKGIEKVLGEHPDKIHAMLGELVRHPAKGIAALKEYGKPKFVAVCSSR